MRGFLEARRSWEAGSRLTTGDLSPFHERESYLSYSQKSASSTFSHDISPAKLRRTAWVRNPQGISKLVNKVDCRLPYDSFWEIPKCNLHLITSQWVSRASLKAIVWAFLATKSFAAGSSMYPCHMACASKSVPRDVISSKDCRPQGHRSAMDVMHDGQG
jgi:hypothetical protein